METTKSLGPVGLHSLSLGFGVLPRSLTIYHILLVREAFHLGQEKLFQAFCHYHNVLPRLVVNVTISEHLIEVSNSLICRPVEVVLQPLLDTTHVHGLVDNFEVVREVQFHCVNWAVERPCMCVLPHGLNQVGF